MAGNYVLIWPGIPSSLARWDGYLQPDRNFLKFLLFMSYFPQIIQGPIPRHSQLAAQLYEGHGYDYTRVTRGAQLMLWGI